MKKAIGYDLGKSNSGMEVTASNKKEKYYPTIDICENELPYLDDLNVGDEISLITLFEVKAITARTGEDKRFTLEIKKVAEESGMKLSKELEKFLGEHKEIEDEDKEDDEKEAD